MRSMNEGKELSIGEVANLFGLTVRTLHHWDEIHLVCPRWRSASNARLYTRQEIERIQHVLTYRAAGFSLDAIKKLLDDTQLDRATHFRRQRELLVHRQEILASMIHALDMLSEEETHMTLDHIDQRWGQEFEAEAKQRWGHTEEWAAAARAKEAMTPKQWQSLQVTTDDLERRLAQALNDGIASDSPQAMALAEEQRLVLSTWFPMTHSKHCLVSRGYTEDPRFQQYYERRAQGLSVWLRAAIEANARAHGVDPENAQWV